jgi:hypothetical protein
MILKNVHIDWIITDIKTINDLIKNDFKNFTDPTKYFERKEINPEELG